MDILGLSIRPIIHADQLDGSGQPEKLHDSDTPPIQINFVPC